jgi:acetate kinase
VHGGSKYFEPTRVDAGVLADLKSYVPLAPLHQPFALEAIAALLDEQPQLPQVACFDTAFHQSMPTVEKMLPLPRSAWQQGLRRYGFHGLSYAYVAQALGERYGVAARGRTIVAHLGSGASLCALQDLRSVATTMGFSALDGLMMGTRCGALDPGAVIYLMEIRKLSLEQVARMLYHESGLLGVSGISSDPRVLLQHEDDARAREALDLYVRSAVREVGALAAALNGLDMLAFTAGIGEHNAAIRERICAGLGFLGIVLDPSANAAHAPLISSAASKVRVVVEPTNEEWVVASAAATLIRH